VAGSSPATTAKILNTKEDVVRGLDSRLCGLDRGGSPNDGGFLGEIQEGGGSRRERSLGCFALFVGGRVEPGHDGNILITKHKRHARA
jgi:hypothetical protein